MNITHRIEKDTCIFKFEDSFATEMVDQIRQYVDPFVKNNKIFNFIFNFKNVDHVDSTGIGVILELHETLQERQAQLIFCEINDYINDIFDVTNIDTLVTIRATEEEALSKLN